MRQSLRLTPGEMLRNSQRFNIGVGAIPLHQIPRLVIQGHHAKKKPPIIAIEPPQSRFGLSGPSSHQDRFPIIQKSGEIRGMNRSLPTPAACPFKSEARVINQALVEILDEAIRQGGPDQSWNGVDRKSQIILVSLQRLFGSLALID